MYCDSLSREVIYADRVITSFGRWKNEITVINYMVTQGLREIIALKQACALQIDLFGWLFGRFDFAHRQTIFGPFIDKHYVLVSNGAFSQWPEVVMTKSLSVQFPRNVFWKKCLLVHCRQCWLPTCKFSVGSLEYGLSSLVDESSSFLWHRTSWKFCPQFQ